MESSQEDETSKAEAGAREEGGQYIQEEVEVGVFALASLLLTSDSLIPVEASEG